MNAAPHNTTDGETRSRAWPIVLAIGGYLAAHSHCILGEAERAGLDADVLLRVASSVVHSPWTYVVALTGCLLLLRRPRG